MPHQFINDRKFAKARLLFRPNRRLSRSDFERRSDFAVLEAGITEAQRHALNAAYSTLTATPPRIEMDNVMFEIPVVDQMPVDART